MNKPINQTVPATNKWKIIVVVQYLKKSMRLVSENYLKMKGCKNESEKILSYYVTKNICSHFFN